MISTRHTLKEKRYQTILSRFLSSVGSQHNRTNYYDERKNFIGQKINQSENQKTTSTVIEDKNHNMVDHSNQLIKQILCTNDSSMSGESKHVQQTQNLIIYPMVSILFTGHTYEWRYPLYNEVPSLLTNSTEKNNFPQVMQACPVILHLRVRCKIQFSIGWYLSHSPDIFVRRGILW